jgi:hypothetical protein
VIGIRVRRMVLVAGALGLTIATGTFAGASAAAISGGVAGGRGACAGRAPRQLSVTRDGPTQVRVRWHAPLHGHPSAYRLLRSGATVGQTSTLAMVAALAVHTRATFAVQARYANGRACAAKVAMQMRYQLPGRVSHLRVLRSASSSLTIAWRRARAGQAPLAGYRVKRDGAVVGQTRHTTLKLSVDLQTRHTIVVYAVDSAGHLGPRSAALHVGAAKGTAGLRPPTQLAVSSVSDESATVSWLPGKSRGTPIVGYRVYRNGDAVGQTAKTSMTLTHLSSRQTYSITVTSVDGAGAQSAPSGALKLTTTHRSPAPPSLLAAQSVSDTSVTLTWSPGSASSGTLAGYLVYENGQAEKSESANTPSP